MAEYFDIGTNIDYMIRAWNGTREKTVEIARNENIRSPTSTTQSLSRQLRRGLVDPSLCQVREGACLVGFNREALQGVKLRIHQLMEDPYPLESFHVKKITDIGDGALLVPKVIFVAVHCPGKKLLDEETDEGQLDYLYDEACEIGADVMVIYIGLPKAVYPHMKHMVYHPKMSEILFPSQRILRDLAEHHSLITVTGNHEFTFMQKNVIREWLQKPVGSNHPVYQTANSISSVDTSDIEIWSESEVRSSSRRPAWDFEVDEPQFRSATEEHPLADKAAKKHKKKIKKKKSSKYTQEATVRNDRDLIMFGEEDFNPSADVEMAMYQDGGHQVDDMGWALSNSL